MKKILRSGAFVLLLTLIINCTAFAIEKFTLNHSFPKGNGISVTLAYDEKAKPEDFVVNVDGREPVDISFVNEPDYKMIGTQSVEIKLTDVKGRESVVTAYLHVTPVKQKLTLSASKEPADVKEFLNVTKDVIAVFSDGTSKIDISTPSTKDVGVKWDGDIYTTKLTIVDGDAPVFYGLEDLDVVEGDTISYKTGINALDEIDGEVEFAVDASKVNLSKEGSYEVTYSAKDKSGNEAKKTIKVNVEKPSDYAAEVETLTDQVLASIIKDGMNEAEKIKAIFDYVIHEITYVGDSDKSDWLKGAYLGFTKKKGDCFTYFACSKALLTKLNIENIDVVRIGNHHYWNLVNIGTGYYHFDASPKPIGVKFRCFMKTDAEVAEYGPSVGRPDYYDFDQTLYPATPTESFEDSLKNFSE